MAEEAEPHSKTSHSAVAQRMSATWLAKEEPARVQPAQAWSPVCFLPAAPADRPRCAAAAKTTSRTFPSRWKSFPRHSQACRTAVPTAILGAILAYPSWSTLRKNRFENPDSKVTSAWLDSKGQPSYDANKLGGIEVNIFYVNSGMHGSVCMLRRRKPHPAQFHSFDTCIPGSRNVPEIRRRNRRPAV
jgi:hypothetical protein